MNCLSFFENPETKCHGLHSNHLISWDTSESLLLPDPIIRSDISTENNSKKFVRKNTIDSRPNKFRNPGMALQRLQAFDVPLVIRAS